MDVTSKSRTLMRLRGALFLLLFVAIIVLCAWLSTRYHYQVDWTASGRNSLSSASISLLEVMDEPIAITSFARPNSLLRKGIKEVVARYQRYKGDISLSFVNPDTAPEQVRELGITVDGELLIEYAGRQQQVKTLSEHSVTNALQRVMRRGERWLIFLQGHGERDPHGRANHDLGDWGNELERKGFGVHTINLAGLAAIPHNASALVIAGPQVALLPSEVALIRAYIEEGGNLLWLGDPGPLHGLEPIAQQLGLAFLPGTVVDPAISMYGISDPSFVIVSNYGSGGISAGFDLVTLFPRAAGLKPSQDAGWQRTAFLRTLPRSWVETGGDDRTGFNQGSDIAGPLTIGISLSRTLDDTAASPPSQPRQQRVVVVGDGDFLANAYLGNGGNLELGMNMINWLSEDEQLVNIPAHTTPDASLTLTKGASAVIGFGHFIVVPLVLLGSGAWVWRRRRRR